MKLAEFSIKHPQFTTVVFFAATVIGLVSFLTIPQSEDPVFPVPTFSVIAVYPGATPEDLEQLVVDSVEDRLHELDDVKKIKTTIQDGLAVIGVEFDASADADKKYDDVVREVNALRPDLPADLARLDVERFNTSDVNIVEVALVSDARPYRELEDQAKELEDRLGRVAGVKTVKRWAYPEREVRVELDPGRLAQLRLPVARVFSALQSEAANIPGGSVAAGRRKFDVKTSSGYRAVDQVQATVVAGTGAAAVHLEDVANVAWGYADQHDIGRYNGHRAVFVTVNMKEGERIGQVRGGIYRELDAFEKGLPPGMSLERGFDQALNVKHRLTRLGEDFAIAILLVLITLLPLGTRASLVVMIAIPLSLAIGIALLKTSGFSLNQLSIVGAVIALGLLVDDSIVVVENIARFLRAGATRQEAAISATRQIALAVIGCTAALVASFIPLLALPGAAGRYIRSLPVTVIYTIVASLVISLTIVPFLASRILREEKDEHGNAFLRGLNWVIDRGYGKWLHRALARPRATLIAAAVVFVGTLALVPAIGFSLFPNADTPQLLVTIETPIGSSLTETDRAARFVEASLRQLPDVKADLMNVGRGNPQIYYNVIPTNERSNYAEAFVLLHHFDPKRTPLMLDSLQQTLDRFPNARIQVKPFMNGPPIDAPVALRIVGTNLDTLRTLAARLQQVIRGAQGTRNVFNPLERLTTDVRVEIDRRKAGLLGIPTVEVDRTVRMGLAGLQAGSIREESGNQYAIRVRLPSSIPGDTGARSLDGAPPLRALDQLYVGSVTGAQVPLPQVTNVHLETSTPEIQHYNKERSVTITAEVRSGFNTDRVTKTILHSLASWQLPKGYRILPAGELESRAESFGGLGIAIMITVFLILAILILEFKTFKSTLIVASVIPLGVVGGLVALFLSGNTLSFTSMIGFVALLGIEIKNSILLVDFTNQLREQGLGVDEAVEKAGKIRFLPIVLTTATAVGGMLPLAIQGSSLYSPLAQVIIGGLISSTLLARLVTPVMYKLLAPEIHTEVDRPAVLASSRLAMSAKPSAA